MRLAVLKSLKRIVINKIKKLCKVFFTYKHNLITIKNILYIMKVKDGIIGLIVGDALGVPVEFSTRAELALEHPVTKMKGYGTHNQPPGTWSDDSAMTLATMHSIVQKQRR